MDIVNFRNIIVLFFLLVTSFTNCFANESASVNINVVLPKFLQIKTITSPVLTANITDKTGNLYAPLNSKFRVISNDPDTRTIYLRANTLTDAGLEEALFDRGGRVYIAFSYVSNKPKTQALKNCKMGMKPNESPGVVAYPISSIIGAKHQYKRGSGKYEVYIDNGTTDITVNVGTNVLKSSFAENDPKGFYQATLLLTESDI